MLDPAALARLTVLRVELRALEPQLIPAFAGSALHGALGRALWHTACSFRARAECPGCPLFGRCAYPALFAARPPEGAVLGFAGVNEQAPRPMVLAPEPGWLRPSGRSILLRAGEVFPFRLTLIGSAWRELPALAVALNQLAAQGIGRALETPPSASSRPRRPPLALARLIGQPRGELLYEDGRFTLAPARELAWPISQPPARLRQAAIEVLTPMRLKRDGRIVSRPSAQDFLALLARRANLLAQIERPGAALPADERAVAASAATLQTVEANTRLVCVRRFSATQGRKMTWPGIIGRFRWAGEALGPLWPLLAWGEQAQLGKGTALGFGRYAARPMTEGLRDDTRSGARAAR